LAVLAAVNSWTMPVLVRPAFQADPPHGAACCECDGKWFWTEASAPAYGWQCCTCIPALAREVRLVCTNLIQFTLLDMARNNTATNAVGSAVVKLLHIAMRQQQAAWWLRYAPGRQTSDLLAELAGRLAADGRMDAETLRMVVKEVYRLRHGVISGREDLTLGL
jgi:hypothetical protein